MQTANRQRNGGKTTKLTDPGTPPCCQPDDLAVVVENCLAATKAFLAKRGILDN